jgi:hypothetical protein
MPTTEDLFAADIGLVRSTRVQKIDKAVSTAQKAFNRFTKKIAQQRDLLLEWQNTIPKFQQKHREELLPCVASYNEQRIQLVKLFDQVYAEKIFTKNDKAKLADLIERICTEVLGTMDDAEIKAIHNRYSEVDFDEAADQHEQAMQAMMESMLDIDLGDDVDFNSPEDVARKIAEQLQEKQAQEEAAKPERKKSAKTLAKEAREKQEAQQVTQSLREVYRKLASALHPDKEQDVAERERKTLLMQRVNVAYDAKDLLGLLSLQLEAEQLTQDNINALSETRLKQYNKLLSEQLADLQQEIEEITMRFMMNFQKHPQQDLSPRSVMLFLQRDIQHIKNQLSGIKKDLVDFKQPKNLKAWLKNYEIPNEYPFDEDDEDAMDIIKALFASR